ncbi:signal peptidase I [Bacillus sp. JJ1532]|uniref:signal peptidase I n=1 Tax=Bacillus sp. JJ1532 TaxID=3122958 RepID=UPI003000312D
MTKKILNWTGNIFLAILILLSLSSIYSLYQSKQNPNYLPSILGFKVMTVLTGSMEPKLEPGDLVAVKAVDPEKLKVDEIITYRNNENTFVTHRIIELVNQDGKVFFQTQGDANNMEDEGLVSAEQVIGSVRFHIPNAGYLTDFIKSPPGLIIIAAIFLVCIAIGISQNFFSTNRKTPKSEIKA